MIELLLTLFLFVLLAQLLFSFIPGLDNRAIGILIVVLILVYFFGGRRFTRHGSREAPPVVRLA